MLPFEFTIEGPPLSHQTHDKAKLEAWRKRVRDAAAKRWLSDHPVSIRLRIRVTYYHEGESVRLDNDNMVKPIQDALNMLVYIDDKQITHTDIVKVSIDGTFYVRGMSFDILQLLSIGDEFLHIRVEEAPDPAEALRRP
jgi:crossover junction endodeoxyribonuclease RusA